MANGSNHNEFILTPGKVWISAMAVLTLVLSGQQWLSSQFEHLDSRVTSIERKVGDAQNEINNGIRDQGALTRSVVSEWQDGYNRAIGAIIGFLIGATSGAELMLELRSIKHKTDTNIHRLLEGNHEQKTD